MSRLAIRFGRQRDPGTREEAARAEAAHGSLTIAATGRAPQRTDGYAPIADYAAIGDGRTSALVAFDGSIDWLCLPDGDSPSAFGAILDAERGGSFRLGPEGPFTAARRYLPDSNVLETTFLARDGAVRVTDAMALPLGGLAPDREVVRRVEGISGSVPMRWSVEPRFRYGASVPRIERRSGVPVAITDREALAVRSWSAGEPGCGRGSIAGRFKIRGGGRATIALSVAHSDPLVLPSRDEVEARLDATTGFWQRWARARAYDGPWREPVIRSALVLKLLIHSPSGAIAAAATSSLPETIGGERNWDYRFSWIRDSAFTLDSLLRLGCPHEAEAFFWWLLHASQLTHPELRVLYRFDGGTRVGERALPLEGYRGSGPVRVGNQAVAQLQLDVYGHLIQTAWLYARAGGELGPDAARRLAETADLVCSLWREPDSGIWEVRSPPAHFTQSKMMCWVALDRALSLAAEGAIPARGAGRWRRESAAIRRFVEEACWSRQLDTYVRYAGGSDVDASLLLGAMMGYGSRGDPRMRSTIAAVRRELGRGALLYRYRADDGLRGDEGAFLACSFWQVDALARAGELDEAAGLMDESIGLANDVGLYAEELDPQTNEFLGNFPQGLVHLALINSAITLAEEQAR